MKPAAEQPAGRVATHQETTYLECGSSARSGSIVERIERNFNDLSQGWYTDPALVDTALRCIAGGEDDQGRAVFRLTPVHGRTCIDFTPAGREWIKTRLTETHGGAHAPYGRRLGRALYGEGFFGSHGDRLLLQGAAKLSKPTTGLRRCPTSLPTLE